jgi:hypothetical protein
MGGEGSAEVTASLIRKWAANCRMLLRAHVGCTVDARLPHARSHEENFIEKTTYSNFLYMQLVWLRLR